VKTWKDVMEAIRNGHSIVVEFDKGVGDQEGYLEPGMRGKLVSFTEEDDTVVRFVVDLTEFDAFNRPFESANYFDKSGDPTLTAREAGYYPKDHRESLYVDENDELGVIAHVVEGGELALYSEFREAQSKDHVGYTQWLEHQVAQLRLDLEDAKLLADNRLKEMLSLQEQKNEALRELDFMTEALPSIPDRSLMADTIERAVAYTRGTVSWRTQDDEVMHRAAATLRSLPEA